MPLKGVGRMKKAAGRKKPSKKASKKISKRKAAKSSMKARALRLAVFLAPLPFLPRLAAEMASKEGERKGYRVEQFKLTARDGTKLSAALYAPEGEGPFPAIIMIHSWFFSRWQCHLYAPYFASSGYVVLSYDCRGWGSSGDQVHCADPNLEINDLIDAIDWLTRSSGLPLKEGAIGVTGISYGGGHSFLIAARDPRVRTVVPMNGWTDLKESLQPHGSLKIAWGVFLIVTATWATKLNPRNDLYRWVRNLLLRSGDLQAFEEDMAKRSALHMPGEVTCPMLIVCSWNDELFEPNQNMEYYERLAAPKMLYVTNGIHGIDAGVGPRLWGKEIWELTKRWFDYWLKGEENGVLSEPAVQLYSPWKHTMISEPEWPPSDIEIHQLFLRVDDGEYKIGSRPEGEVGSRLLKPSLLTPVSSGPTILPPRAFGLYVPGPRKEEGKGYFSFTTSPSKRDYELLGAPRLTLTLRPMSPRVQLNALLYDVPPHGLPRLITHGTLTLEDQVPGEEVSVSMDLIARDYLMREGHRFRLTLSGSNLPFALPVKSEGVEVVYGAGESGLQLPLRAVSSV
jgi:predicted acyl esterase